MKGESKAQKSMLGYSRGRARTTQKNKEWSDEQEGAK